MWNFFELTILLQFKSKCVLSVHFQQISSVFSIVQFWRMHYMSQSQQRTNLKFYIENSAQYFCYGSSLQVWRECLPACERKRFHEATQQGRELLLRRIFCFCKRASRVRCNISVSNLHFFLHINCLAFFCVMKLK